MRSSLRQRILFVLLAAQGLLTTIAATVVVIHTHRQMLIAFDTELHRRMLATLTMVRTADEKPDGVEFEAQPNAIPKDDLYRIWDDHNAEIAASPSLRNALHKLLPSKAAAFFHAHGRLYRGEIWHSAPVFDEEGEGGESENHQTTYINLAYAIPAETFHRSFLNVVIFAALGSVFFLISSSLIAHFSVSRGLVPLEALAAQAAKITEHFWDFHSESYASELSELRPLVKALEELVGRLKSAFDRERKFVGDAAHELKTAVAIQKSTLQVAIQGPKNLQQYHKGLEQALSDVDRLERLVLRMLSLASVEGSTYEGSFGPVALEETLLSALDQLKPLAELNKVELDNSGITCCYVWGHTGLLQTLWVALIENAIQHSPQNSRIKVTNTPSASNQYRISILDCGEGIEPQELPRIFDRFYRADPSRSRNTGGFGLGLAISKAIVERHHGSILIESTPGKGTTVKVDLLRASQ